VPQCTPMYGQLGNLVSPGRLNTHCSRDESSTRRQTERESTPLRCLAYRTHPQHIARSDRHAGTHHFAGSHRHAGTHHLAGSHRHACIHHLARPHKTLAPLARPLFVNTVFLLSHCPRRTLCAFGAVPPFPRHPLTRRLSCSFLLPWATPLSSVTLAFSVAHADDGSINDAAKALCSCLPLLRQAGSMQGCILTWSPRDNNECKSVCW